MPDRDQMITRQRTLADFGAFALKSEDLDEVLTEACQLVGKALGTDLAKVLEIERHGPDEQMLFVRAGVGWPEGVVGEVRLPMGERSSETYAIEHGEPVLTSNIRDEDRFEFPEFMKAAGVVGIINVPIFLPGQKAFGLLQVDSREEWKPDEQDVQFLRTYATILGPVIDRLHKVHALRLAEQRNETLLRELQHRIKNNIGAITSLVRLRMNRATSDEARVELGVVGERIEALRLVHEQVYATGAGDRLHLAGYVTKLLDGLLALHRETPVRLDVQIDDVEIASDDAIPLGLILNEFTTNSLKHAFDEASDECIRVEARRRGEGLRLSISDNGRGLPAESRTARPGFGTGRAMIDGLARQLQARSRWMSENGTVLDLELARIR